MLSYFTYLIFRGAVAFFSVLPFSILYVFADFLAILLAFYRKKVVMENLKIAFPEKNDAQIRQISKKFYAHLGQIFVEVIKGFSMSEQQVRERFTIESTEVSNRLLSEGKNILALTAHYNNWEWGALGSAFLTHAQVFALYKPLSNTHIDRYVRERRKAWGCHLHPIHLTQRLMAENAQRKAAVYILAADQSPSNLDKAIWVNFFGVPTACLHGAEHYAQSNTFGIIFYELHQPKKGYYQLKEIEIPYDATQAQKGELTQRYFQLLEAEIRREPAYWLWSHKRWKHRR